MRNLKLCTHVLHKLSSPLAPNSFICIDSLSNSIFLVNSSQIWQIKKTVKSFEEVLISSWKTLNVEIGEVIAADFLPVLNCICVVTKEDIVTFCIDDNLVEVVGSVSDGILAAQWSPDQELLALVTATHSLVLMTTEFDPIAEFSLEQEEFGENRFVNVGWGKKETQFHGSVGKGMAKEVRPSSSTIFEWDDKLPRITWRGDGQLFAVTYVSKDSKTRKFRVISREGNIQSTSEDVEGLEFALSWKPSGSLIATTRRLSNKHNVSFFEKNGLMHNEFTLPFKASEVLVKCLLWNEDSSLLLVWIVPFDKKESIVQLWKIGNYHWYLKKVLRFKELLDVQWDTESPLILFALESSHLHIFEFISTVDLSRGRTSSDLSLVSVIDGKRLLITAFRNSIIPPPISAYEVVFPDEIDDVCFAPAVVEKSETSQSNLLSIEDSGFLEAIDHPGNTSNNLCVFHGNNKITFLTIANPSEQLSDYSCVVNLHHIGMNSKVHRVFSQHTLENSISPPFDEHITDRYYNWTWVCKSRLVACCTRSSDLCDFIAFELEGITMESGKVRAIQNISLDEHLSTISLSPDGSVVCLQHVSGSLSSYLPLEGPHVKPWINNNKKINFPSPCTQVILCPINNDFVTIGLTSRNRLFLGDLQLLADATSIFLHIDHLLITTTSHSLLIVPLTMDAFLSLSKGAQSEFSEIGIRRIERGARLVTSIACDTKVLMQMPRGNLEMISPRTLVVHTLKNLLNEHKYYLAVDTMRKQRIDMNLIYDHDPEDFLANLGSFVEGINKPQWLDIFIANLTENDVTKTVYSCNYAEENKVKAEGERKVNKIIKVCNAIREAMTSFDEEKFLLPILTSYVKSSDSDMDSALKKLHNMKKTNKEFKVSFTEGLHHLLLVSDVNELCNIALGTYDFDLVMMVFEKSQKDPKEYLPFLNSLRKLNEPYRHFKIDVHLKRFKRALHNLCHCEEEYAEEGLELICKEKLYSTALEILPKESNIYKRVCKSYGDYLSSKCYNGEAAIMYSRASQLKEALDAYVSAVDWRGALTTAFRMNLNQATLNSLYLNLIERLKDRESYSEVAFIYERYLHNEEEAVVYHVMAFNWHEALRIACNHQRTDLVDDNIKSAVLYYHKSLECEIPERLDSFIMRCERLSNVRVSKEKEFNAFKEVEDHQLDADLYSDASTVTGISRQHTMHSTSSSTIKTYKSTKNKRKLERKKCSTKEGSTYEDLGLVVTLHDSMCEIDNLSSDVHNLNSMLIYFEEDQKAKHLQTIFDDLVTEVKKRKDTIWPRYKADDENIEFGPQMSSEAVVQKLKGPSNSSFNFVSRRMRELEPCYQFPPTMKNSNWKLVSLR